MRASHHQTKKRELPKFVSFRGLPPPSPDETTHLERDGLAREGLDENLHGGRPVGVGCGWGACVSFFLLSSPSPLPPFPPSSLLRMGERTRGQGQDEAASVAAAPRARPSGLTEREQRERERERGRAKERHKKQGSSDLSSSPLEVVFGVLLPAGLGSCRSCVCVRRGGRLLWLLGGREWGSVEDGERGEETLVCFSFRVFPLESLPSAKQPSLAPTAQKQSSDDAHHAALTACRRTEARLSRPWAFATAIMCGAPCRRRRQPARRSAAPTPDRPLCSALSRPGHAPPPPPPPPPPTARAAAAPAPPRAPTPRSRPATHTRTRAERAPAPPSPAPARATAP